MKRLQLVLIFLLIISYSCKKESVKNNIKKNEKSTIKYAKGFDIIDKNGSKKLIIKSAYQNSDKFFEYNIYNSNSSKKIKHTDVNIRVPIENIVVTSTTHIPMVEYLNEETSIIGFPYAKYVSSKKTRALIDAGKIKEIGKESSLNTEILLDFFVIRAIAIFLSAQSIAM